MFCFLLLCSPYNEKHKGAKKNKLRDQITILKNGREIRFLSGLETKLENGNEISVFPPVHGG